MSSDLFLFVVVSLSQPLAVLIVWIQDKSTDRRALPLRPTFPCRRSLLPSTETLDIFGTLSLTPIEGSPRIPYFGKTFVNLDLNVDRKLSLCLLILCWFINKEKIHIINFITAGAKCKNTDSSFKCPHGNFHDQCAYCGDYEASFFAKGSQVLCAQLNCESTLHYICFICLYIHFSFLLWSKRNIYSVWFQPRLRKLLVLVENRNDRVLICRVWKHVRCSQLCPLEVLFWHRCI